MLTQLIVGGVHLNDGVQFLVAEEQDLDAQNPSTGAWASRAGRTPILTDTEIQQSSLNLNIQIVPTHDPADFEARLRTLKILFPTGALVTITRQLRTDSVQWALNASVREFTVSRTNRRVSISLETADRAWRRTVVSTVSQRLFTGTTRLHTLVLQNNGAMPVEPTITLTPKTVGTDGPTPLYYRELTVYAAGNGGRGSVLGSPIQLTTNWNTSALVSAGKMRSDGLDISVTLPDGTALPTYVAGTASARSIWVLANRWQDQSYGVLVRGPGAGADGGAALLPSDTVAYVSQYGDEAWPGSGQIRIGNTSIVYSTAEVYEDYPGSAGRVIRLGGLVGGRTVSLPAFTPVMRPTVLRINYGYASGYARAFSNSLVGWPPLNYTDSSNAVWVQDVTATDQQGLWNWVWASGPRGKSLRRGEWVRFVPVSGQVSFESRYLPNDVAFSIWDRAEVGIPSVAGRIVDSIELNFNVVAPGTGVRVSLEKLMYGRATEAEITDSLYNQVITTAGTVSTGFLPTNQRARPCSHLLLSQLNALPGTDQRHITLTRVRYLLDTDGYSRPFVDALGAEGGAAYGEYPLSVSLVNLNDSTIAAFRVATQVHTNEPVLINAETRKVVGANLTEVTYQQPVWLRLLPGENSIQVSAPPGSGEVDITIAWQERL